MANVVIFGETGAGKSSLINLIVGRDIAPVSSQSVGCTLQSTCYPVEILGKRFNLHDTAGLDEGQGGTVANRDAVMWLHNLLRGLDTGISLLVFCMKGPRINKFCVKNWRLFREDICQMCVPIVLAVTGLENEEPSMDNWWTQNEKDFIGYNMYPNGVACVTAMRGKQISGGGYRFDEEYSESQVKIRRSIRMLHLHHPWRVW